MPDWSLGHYEPENLALCTQTLDPDDFHRTHQCHSWPPTSVYNFYTYYVHKFILYSILKNKARFWHTFASDT